MTLQLKSLEIQVKYTAPDTPQMNGVVEHGFVFLSACARAMMLTAKFKFETHMATLGQILSKGRNDQQLYGNYGRQHYVYTTTVIL